MTSTLSFVNYFMRLAEVVSTKSKDRSTKVGAIITGPGNEIRSTGYNGFPSGANDDREEWHERPTKYLVTVHAEENAIAFAAKNGTKIENCNIYVTHMPCAKCMRLIIQSGIKKVYISNSKLDGNEAWKEEFEKSMMLANDCGVLVTRV